MSVSEKSNRDFVSLLICISVVACSVIVGIFVSNINDRNNMAKNIDAAIQKGVDPISVKCSYELTPTSTCIAYTLSSKK